MLPNCSDILLLPVHAFLDFPFESKVILSIPAIELIAHKTYEKKIVPKLAKILSWTFENSHDKISLELVDSNFDGFSNYSILQTQQCLHPFREEHL